MLDVLNFIFKDFWHFTGTLLIITIISLGISRIGNKTFITYERDKDDIKDKTNG